MADKFLNTGGSGQANISNGTANVYAANLAAANLDPSRPIKTNAVRELVSQNLDIADINNLQSALDNVLTNPFVGTLQVSDLETDDTFSLNDEIQKISNITSATQGTPNITVFDGEIDVKVIKSATHNAELEFDNTDCNLTADGDITLLTAAGDIQLNGNSLTMSGPSFTYNGYDVLDTQGNKNIDATLTTTQTVFTNDQQLITKKYVDDAGGGGDADIKTQNISLGLTDNTKTTFDKGDVIFGTNPMEVLDEFSIKQELNFNNITAPETGGFQFTIRNPIIIKYVCFKVSHWGSTDTTKQWNLYDDDSRQLIAGLTLDKLKEYKGYYYTQPITPIYIEAGSYKCALILNNGDKKHNFSNAGDFFNDNFLAPGGVFSSPDPAPTLAYPNGGSNTPSSAIVFDVVNKVIAEGAIEARYGLGCNQANLGIEYNNYFLDGLGDGAGNLYGSPALTTNAVYTSVLALGGVAGTAGKATYEIFDLTKAGTRIQIYKNFRFAPWTTDGGFINADFGVWRVEYQNFPVAGTSKWDIYANGGIIHTNTTNLIVPSSTYSEEDITIDFDVDTQVFIIKHFNQILFSFTDATPRTITQAQRNLYSVSGGAVAGYTNTTTIYDQKVYNPGSSTYNMVVSKTNATIESDLNVSGNINTVGAGNFTGNGDLILTGNIDTQTIEVGGGGGLKYMRIKESGNILCDGISPSVGPTVFLQWLKPGGIPASTTIGSLYWKGQTAEGNSAFLAQIRARVINTLTNADAGSDILFSCKPSGSAWNQGPGDKMILGGDGTTQIINTNLIQLKTTGANTTQFEATTTGVKFYNDVVGMPYDVIFAATDEVNTITATGQKMSIRVPRSFQTSKIKVSVNSVGGAGFAVDIKYNGGLVQSIAQGSFLVSNTTDTTTYSEDNIITCEVSNIGAGTATGLKVYLIGKTI